ncbi:MAG: DUF1697 domain-containing protein [Bacteroidales bacterium]|jgi:uncharacterized protein (DUF1697 family)|nr:DUF1697 domain-containing protein [Bacteroidales bacterium]
MERMGRYVAFLRGINVGGKNLILMPEMRALFGSSGLSHVETFIQSGNVKFTWDGTDLQLLKIKLERRLEILLGQRVAVIMRSLEELQDAVRNDPFMSVSTNLPVKYYVCFLEKIPEHLPELPLRNEKEGLEVIMIRGANVYIVSHEVKGRYGFPNNFIEKELGLLSTARNWNTVQKITGIH